MSSAHPAARRPPTATAALAWPGASRRTRHPLPGRGRRPGGQGRQLHRPRRRRGPRRDGACLRRRGRRRAGLPRHHRQQRVAGDDVRRGPPHGRTGVHPADRGGRRPQSRGRGPSAARRCRQGRREHGRDRPTRPAARDRRPLRSQVLVLSVDARRAPGRRAVSRSPRTAGGRAPASTPWRGRSAGRSWGGGGAAQLDGRRRDPPRLRPGARAGRAVGRHRARDRQRGSGRVEDFAPAVEAGADAVLAASVFHFGTLRIGEVKQALRDAGQVVR